MDASTFTPEMKCSGKVVNVVRPQKPVPQNLKTTQQQRHGGADRRNRTNKLRVSCSHLSFPKSTLLASVAPRRVSNLRILVQDRKSVCVCQLEDHLAAALGGAFGLVPRSLSGSRIGSITLPLRSFGGCARKCLIVCCSEGCHRRPHGRDGDFDGVEGRCG